MIKSTLYIKKTLTKKSMILTDYIYEVVLIKKNEYNS